jgi:hypothetical protein
MPNEKWFPDFKRRLGRILHWNIAVYFWDTLETFTPSNWEEQTDYFRNIWYDTELRNIYYTTVERLCAQVLHNILREM